MGNDDTRSLDHRCLEDGSGVALTSARLTDRQRLAVVLQGAALIAHLEQVGWHLPAGWQQVQISGAGELRTGRAAPGRQAERPQELLRRLLGRVFRSSGAIAGRGQARRAARALQAQWWQSLTTVSADQAVEDVLRSADFLWRDDFAIARLALVAEIQLGGQTRLWVAGPGRCRGRLLRAAKDRSGIEACLSGPAAKALWEGFEAGDQGVDLARRGALRRAVAAWHRQPPKSAEEALSLAECLFRLGRFGLGREALASWRGLGPRLLRARCRLELGELPAVARAVRRLAEEKLSPTQAVDLAEIAVRTLANLGDLEGLATWVARARRVARGELAPRARLLAAEAAWDGGRLQEMADHLQAARSARELPGQIWRWHQVAGLLALSRKDGLGAAEHFAAALTAERRLLPRRDAGRLWSELARCRVLIDDLAGAERAARHALRQLWSCDGPAGTTLALFNLAEVRLRRGRPEGVEETLEASVAANRRSGNLRGQLHDLELWTRLELSRGRPASALAYVREAERLASRSDLLEPPGLAALAARAHLWLGRQAQARDYLRRADPEGLQDLEAEERPALMALAGWPERAVELAAGTSWSELWQALALGQEPPRRLWEQLGGLEPSRASRLIFDLELLRRGVVPGRWLRRAMATLRSLGARSLAEQLESHSSSRWRLLQDYLHRAGEPAAIAGLFRNFGYEEARLILLREGRQRILVDGVGGDHKLVVELPSAHPPEFRLELRAGSKDEVLTTLLSLISRDLGNDQLALEVNVGTLSEPLTHRSGIIGKSPALTEVLERASKLAAGELPILILGQSGTGKELVARLVHQHSPRQGGPFLPINCAALPETLINSELFGHRRGAFTGADRDHPGLFESARGGTVFLDEIGDLPLSVQGSLLRVLQEKEVRRIGESHARKVDVRIIAATHRDLERGAAEKTFRADLFYRLKVATVRLPALSERGEDILLLTDYFLARARGAGKKGAGNLRLTAAARQALLQHSWPGNVRELENVLAVAATLADDDQIDCRHLDLPFNANPAAGSYPTTYHEIVEQTRRRTLQSALEDCDGNRTSAARQLGVSRQTLSYLIKRFSLDVRPR